MGGSKSILANAVFAEVGSANRSRLGGGAALEAKGSVDSRPSLWIARVVRSSPLSIDTFEWTVLRSVHQCELGDDEPVQLLCHTRHKAQQVRI